MHFEILKEEKVSLGTKIYVYFSIGNKGVGRSTCKPSFLH
jgi:hypothetical protein